MTIVLKQEPLTYNEHNQEHSFFRDLVFGDDRMKGASERLRRHRQEMDVIGKEREKRAWASLRAGEFDYERRVEPNGTQGQGGFFDPPLWLTNLFATGRRPGRILGSLIPAKFTLPMGVSSVNLPVMTTGTSDTITYDNAGVPSTDITDAAGSSTAATFSGQANVPLQLLDLSPLGAGMDWVVWTDMTDAYDASLEAQLLYGSGSANQQLPGVVPAAISASQVVTFTNASPTGALLWPFLAQAAAQLGDARERPPECWLMRTARWAWLQGQESTTGYPFGISPVFLGVNDDSTPNPIGGVMGWPVFLNDSLTTTAGAGGNQDQIVSIRPSDLALFETTPRTSVNREPGTANMSAIVEMHGYAAAITRYTSGIDLVSGTGLVVASGY